MKSPGLARAEPLVSGSEFEGLAVPQKLRVAASLAELGQQDAAIALVKQALAVIEPVALMERRSCGCVQLKVWGCEHHPLSVPMMRLASGTDG